MKRVATIGVYGFTAQRFLHALADADVGVVLDVRQRRGVRGPDYTWANSARLQALLSDAGVAYRHVKGLTPTTDMRQAQYREDDRQGVGKRNRQVLGEEYAARYTREILDPFDLRGLVRETSGDSTTALFCVERDAEACHRSLVAQRLHAEFGLAVIDLVPD